MWTINVVDEKEDSMQIDIKRDGVNLDPRDIATILNSYEKRIADLAVKNEELVSSNCSLASDNAWLTKNYEDMVKDYGDMYKKLTTKLDDDKRVITNLMTKLHNLMFVAELLSRAGDGLTVNPLCQGRTERERAWVEAVKVWENYKDMESAELRAAISKFGTA